VLSRIIAGTMNWGSGDKNLSTQEMARLIDICHESGVTTFDHADIYGGYTTESEFGAAYKLSGIDRSKIEIISKCGIQHICSSRPNRIKHYDYSSDYIIWSVENSLKNLQTDYLDVLLLHRPSPLMQPDEIAQAVGRLKAEGKIRSFGLSNFTTTQTDLIRVRTDVDFSQIQFSATHNDAMTNGQLDHMQLYGITPMAWSPLGTVFREDTEQTRRLKVLFAELVAKYHVGSDTILLAWILKHPAGIHPIAGTVNIARITQLHKAVELDLELQDWFAIWTESMGNKVP
jgi:predicted oxidoreductase